VGRRCPSIKLSSAWPRTSHRGHCILSPHLGQQLLSGRERGGKYERAERVYLSNARRRPAGHQRPFGLAQCNAHGSEAGRGKGGLKLAWGTSDCGKHSGKAHDCSDAERCGLAAPLYRGIVRCRLSTHSSPGYFTTMPATTALRPGSTGFSSQVTAVASCDRPAPSTTPFHTPVIGHPDNSASAVGALSSTPRPATVQPSVMLLPPPPQEDRDAAFSPPFRVSQGAGLVPGSSHACEPSVYKSSATLPTFRSCREVQKMRVRGKRGSSR